MAGLITEEVCFSLCRLALQRVVNMMRKTNSRTGKRSKKEERVLGREALSKPISEYEKESLDSENSGYNLSLILSKFLGMANRLVNLADSEMSRIEQIQEEKRLSTEQEMYMEQDFCWCFQQEKK